MRKALTPTSTAHSEEMTRPPGWLRCMSYAVPMVSARFSRHTHCAVERA
jgi:hypothetical protein